MCSKEGIGLACHHEHNHADFSTESHRIHHSGRLYLPVILKTQGPSSQAAQSDFKHSTSAWGGASKGRENFLKKPLHFFSHGMQGSQDIYNLDTDLPDPNLIGFRQGILRQLG